MGFARLCRRYHDRNQCITNTFADKSYWRLVICIYEVQLVRFVEHNTGRQEVNERRVPNFVLRRTL